MKTGKIIRIISNLYTVNIDGKNINCQARGKFRQEKITPLVGDYCEIDMEFDDDDDDDDYDDDEFDAMLDRILEDSEKNGVLRFK